MNSPRPIADLIGRPWQAGAEGPLAFDCRGLVLHVLREHFNLPPPRLMQTPAGAIAIADRDAWRPQHRRDAPRAGDILLCYSATGPHVGIFVSYCGLGVLHSVEPPSAMSGVCFHALDALLAGGAFGRHSVWRHE